MSEGEIVRLEIGASQRLTVALAAMHGLAAAMPWVAALEPLYALPATLAVAASLRHALRGEARRLVPQCIAQIRLHPDCRCEFVTRGGTEHDAEILGSSFVAPYLTVLHLREAESRRTHYAVILADAVNAEAFRKLRVRLKWGCAETGKS